jgi:hypothetical protein
VNWSPPPWNAVGAAGPDQETPDLSAVMQEIIDQPAWSEGNAVVFVVTGSGRRTAEAYNASQVGLAQLNISYLPEPRAALLRIVGLLALAGLRRARAGSAQKR